MSTAKQYVPQTHPPSIGYPKRPAGVEVPLKPAWSRESKAQKVVELAYNPDKPTDILLEVERLFAKEARKRVLGDPTHTKLVQALHLLSDWRGR